MITGLARTRMRDARAGHRETAGREAELKRSGLKHLLLFGSTARNEARSQSDVDLFFDYEKEKIGLFALLGVKELAEEILGSPADVITRGSLHPILRPRIEAEAQRIF